MSTGENKNAVNPSETRVRDFLWDPQNVSRMIVFTERGLPALTGIVEELEQHFSNDPDFPLSNYRYRQAVGRMIKQVMSQFGYVVADSGPKKNTYLRDFANSEFFSTSAVYKRQGNAEKSLSITIV